MGKTWTVDEPTVHEIKVGEVTYRTRPNTVALQIELGDLLDKRQNLRVAMTPHGIAVQRVEKASELSENAPQQAGDAVKELNRLSDELDAVTLELAGRLIVGPDGQAIPADVLHQFPRSMVGDIVDAVLDETDADPTPGQAAGS